NVTAHDRHTVGAGRAAGTAEGSHSGIHAGVGEGVSALAVVRVSRPRWHADGTPVTHRQVTHADAPRQDYWRLSGACVASHGRDLALRCDQERESGAAAAWAFDASHHPGSAIGPPPGISARS